MDNFLRLRIAWLLISLVLSFYMVGLNVISKVPGIVNYTSSVAPQHVTLLSLC